MLFSLLSISILVLADDTTNPLIEFLEPTPDDGDYQTTRYVNINVSLSEENLNNLTYNWTGAQTTLYNQTLLVKYNFDYRQTLGDNTTTTTDISTYNNHGWLNSPSWTENGYCGGAYSFNGIDELIQINNSQNLNFSTIRTNYTLSFWFKTTNENCGLYCVSYTGHDRHLYLSNGNLYQRLWEPNADETIYSTGTNYADGSWHQVVQWVDYDVGQRIYADGVKVAEGTKKYSHFDWAKYAYLGYSDDATTHPYFIGTIDEFEFWNRSLTDQEIYQHYITNLQQYNQSQWVLTINQSKNATTDLDDGVYTYQISAEDTGSLQTTSEQRTIYINVDPTPPVPELKTLLLFSIGLMTLITLIYHKRNR